MLAKSIDDTVNALSTFERHVVWFSSAQQFIVTLGFLVVLPLGPLLSTGLHVGLAQAGWTTAAYSLGSVSSAVLVAPRLDRFDRSKSVALTLFGLGLANLLAAAAPTFACLVGARILSGCFAAPISALAAAIVADSVSDAKRGRAIGSAFSGVSMATVVGIPLSLRLGLWFGWRASFFAAAALCLACSVAARNLGLPPRKQFATIATPGTRWFDRLKSVTRGRRVRLTIVAALLFNIPVFMLVPNLAAYLSTTLGVGLEHLGYLYAIGGVCSLLGTRYVGRAIDRVGTLLTTAASSALLAVIIFVLYYNWFWLQIPLSVLVPAFMLSNSCRIVAQGKLVADCSTAENRAGFMSIVQGALQISSAFGSFLGAMLLTTSSSTDLSRMPVVALAAISLVAFLPFFLFGFYRIPSAPRASA